MIIVFAILGAFLGSFYLVVGSRLPLGDNIVSGRSRCDHCHHVLAWFELIPLFSYIVLKGKCRYCHKNHFLVEIITSIIFGWAYLYFGLTYKLATFLVLISVLIIIFISDIKYMIILDSPLIIGSILITIIRFFEVGLKDSFSGVLYGLALFLTMFLIKKMGDFLFKKESLGGGDIKLAFLMGFTLGYPNIGYRLGLISIVFAAFLALPYALASLYLNKKNELPFGPFLISSLTIMYIFLDKFKNLLIFFIL